MVVGRENHAGQSRGVHQSPHARRAITSPQRVRAQIDAYDCDHPRLIENNNNFGGIYIDPTYRVMDGNRLYFVPTMRPPCKVRAKEVEIADC